MLETLKYRLRQESLGERYVSLPFVSIIWVNYNSADIMDVVLRSLKSVLELDYPEYEVLVVDNASSDGSFERIRDFIKERRGEMPQLRLLRLRVNKGYAGGVTEGFKARDRGSKYAIAMNNDLVALPGALKTLVELAEQSERVGAANGIVMSCWEQTVIDSAGGVLNELLSPESLFSGWDVNEYRVRKPYPATFADGLLALYNVKAVLEANDELEVLYDPWIISYYDDVLVSLKLWNKGWKSVVYPKVIGLHCRSQTFKRLSLTPLYLVTRNKVALNEITNSRFKDTIKALMVKRVLRYPGARLARALRRGLRLGLLLKNLGLRLDLYRAPIAFIPEKEAVKALFGSLGKVNVRAQGIFERGIVRSCG